MDLETSDILNLIAIAIIIATFCYLIVISYRNKEMNEKLRQNDKNMKHLMHGDTNHSSKDEI